MGIFRDFMDAVFGAPEGASWERRLRGWSSMSADERRRLGRALAEGIAGRLDGVAAADPEDEERSAARATIGAIPVRVRLSVGGAMVLEARVDNRRGLVALRRDPSETPSDDAWGDTRVRAVAPGIFLEGRSDHVEAQERRLEEMGDAAAELLQGVERFEATVFTAHARELSLVIGVPVGDQPEPLERAVAAARWLAALAPAFTLGHADPEASVADRLVGRVRCEFCGAFFVKDRRDACPSCGAPVR
ncbi:MAG TPA: hypothetical protein RMH99_20330 [Sandaracinaceae bacterium LLY-WYZ-13_1]|nr:hypothetical protein [Sandaracinaceae bacterium LLY-WYZ-13_1]